MTIELRDFVPLQDKGGHVYAATAPFSAWINPGDHLTLKAPTPESECTLVNNLALLTVSYKGSFRINGAEVSVSASDTLARRRTSIVGVLSHQLPLIQGETLLQNITMPAFYSAQPSKANYSEALAIKLGLSGLLDVRANNVDSEARFIAQVARALSMSPFCLIIQGEDLALQLIFMLNKHVFLRSIACIFVVEKGSKFHSGREIVLTSANGG